MAVGFDDEKAFKTSLPATMSILYKSLLGKTRGSWKKSDCHPQDNSSCLIVNPF